MCKIKICRVSDAQTIRALESLRVDFVGLHLVTAASAARVELLRTLVQHCAAAQLSTKPVLVTKNLDLSELINCTREINPPVVQLHDRWSADSIRRFKARVPPGTAIILAVDPTSDVNDWALDNPQDVDYLLFDRIRGGTGEVLPPEILQAAFCRSTERPNFIAGGLRADNVAQVIERFQPFAVDVQTALEIPDGTHRKDVTKTLAFVAAVKPGPYPLVRLPRADSTLCLSLTDVPVDRFTDLPVSIIESVDVAHLDHADGSVDQRFVRNSHEHARRLRERFPLIPYDLHAFIASPNTTAVASLIESYRACNPFLRAIFCYVDVANPISPHAQLAESRKAAQQHRVGFGLCLQARPLVQSVPEVTRRIIQLAQPDHISVVGPSEATSTHDYQSVVGPYCELVAPLSSNHLIIDRDITVARLEAVIARGVGGAVCGRSIWRAESPPDAIMSLRSVLAKGKRHLPAGSRSL